MLTMLLGLVVLFAYTTQAMIGFGSNIIALTLGAHLWPLPELLPVVVALNLPLSATLAWRSRDDVAWGILWRTITPAFGGGLLLGMAISILFQSTWMALGYGLLVIAIATWELSRLHQPGAPLSRAQFFSFTLVGGLAQGLYASGGPFVAYAADRLQMGRARFRATLLVIWLVANSVLLMQFAGRGMLDAAFMRNTLLFLPLVIAGMWLGDKLHQRVAELSFRRLLYSVLLFSGIALVAKQLMSQ